MPGLIRKVEKIMEPLILTDTVKCKTAVATAIVARIAREKKSITQWMGQNSTK